MASRAILGALALSLSAPAIGAEWHLTEPAVYDDCASRLLRSGSVRIFDFPRPIVEIACEVDDVWGCAPPGTGTIVVADDAPAWLRPWILMHEASHLCGWPADHPGGREIRVTASSGPPGAAP